jgi:hypothetical protein
MSIAAPTKRLLPPSVSGLYAGNIRSVIRRGWDATKASNILTVLSGFFEPVFYFAVHRNRFWRAGGSRPEPQR